MKTPLIAVLIVYLVYVVSILLTQTPPMPPAFNPMGKQHPYISIVSCLHTQVVTQVYEVRYLRTIAEVNLESNLFETNFVTLRTNMVGNIATNSVFPGTPQ